MAGFAIGESPVAGLPMATLAAGMTDISETAQILRHADSLFIMTDHAFLYFHAFEIGDLLAGGVLGVMTYAALQA